MKILFLKNSLFKTFFVLFLYYYKSENKLLMILFLSFEQAEKNY
jgi:hypothetical protein